MAIEIDTTIVASNPPKNKKKPVRTSVETRSVAFRRDSGCLVSADVLGKIREWILPSGKETGTVMRVKGDVYAVVASTDGRWIVSSDPENKVIVWNASTRQVALEISEHTGCVLSIDVSSDSTRIASGSQDQTVRIFDIFSGVQVISPLQHYDSIFGVKFSPDGSRVATVMHSCCLAYVYDALSGIQLFEISVCFTSSPANPLAWSSNGQQLFIASGGSITSYDILTSSSSEWSIRNNGDKVSIVTYNRFIACSSGSSVSFWDSTTRLQIGSVIDHASEINCISVSHDGKYLACGHEKGITVHCLAGFVPCAYLHAPETPVAPLLQLSETVFEMWTRNVPVETEKILSEEIERQSELSHVTLAARSIVRTHMKEWATAIEDAEKSLLIKQSAIGRIARSLSLICASKKKDALDGFDFVFRDGDPRDIILLLVIKSIIMFMCGKQKQAVSCLLELISTSDEQTKGYCNQVLGFMYLKLGDYGNAVRTLKLADPWYLYRASDPLATIFLIFNWDFRGIDETAWMCLCEYLYNSGRMDEVIEALLKMASSLHESRRQHAHSNILQEIMTRSGEVTLLAWTGKSSEYNSCLPSSPSVYTSQPSPTSVSPASLEQEALDKRTDELRAVFSLPDALVFYHFLVRSQPIRFVHDHLHLPCIAFGVRSLKKERENVYRAETNELGDVEFTTTDLLPLKEPRKLVFVDMRMHSINKQPRRPENGAAWGDTEQGATSSESSFSGLGFVGPRPGPGSDMDTEPVAAAHTPIIEEAQVQPSTPPDAYTRALQLIAQLEQPFSTLLLLRQSDGAYKRVATDHEFVVRWDGNNVVNDVRVEVLEIV